MSDNKVCEVLVQDGGILPVKAHRTDAGFDLFASKKITIQSGEIVKHPLNIRLALPPGTYAEITSKSGNGSKGLLVYAGIIDEGYRGIVHVVMTNLNQFIEREYIDGGCIEVLKPGCELEFTKGQKIAQMIIHPYRSDYELKQVFSMDTNTSRGEGGFGSTLGSLV